MKFVISCPDKTRQLKALPRWLDKLLAEVTLENPNDLVIHVSFRQEEHNKNYVLENPLSKKRVLIGADNLNEPTKVYSTYMQMPAPDRQQTVAPRWIDTTTGSLKIINRVEWAPFEMADRALLIETIKDHLTTKGNYPIASKQRIPISNKALCWKDSEPSWFVGFVHGSYVNREDGTTSFFTTELTEDGERRDISIVIPNTEVRGGKKKSSGRDHWIIHKPGSAACISDKEHLLEYYRIEKYAPEGLTIEDCALLKAA